MSLSDNRVDIMVAWLRDRFPGDDWFIGRGLTTAGPGTPYITARKKWGRWWRRKELDFMVGCWGRELFVQVMEVNNGYFVRGHLSWGDPDFFDKVDRLLRPYCADAY